MSRRILLYARLIFCPRDTVRHVGHHFTGVCLCVAALFGVDRLHALKVVTADRPLLEIKHEPQSAITYGLHYSVWTGIAADVRYRWFYGFAAIGSDLSLAPWIIFSAFDSSAGSSASQNSGEIRRRWEINGVGYGVSTGLGPTLTLDDAGMFHLDFLVTGIYSSFYKGGYAFSPGLLLGFRMSLSESVEIGMKIPLIGWAVGQLYTEDNPQQLKAISGGDSILRFFSNTLVSMPFLTIGYRF